MSKFFDKVDAKTIIIFGLIVVIFLLNMCSTNVSDDGKKVKIAGKTYTVIKHEIDTVIVPVKQVVYKKGNEIYREKTVYVNLPSKVDTNGILRDFYSRVIYKDTLKLSDSLGYISIVDTVFNNSILGRKWESYVNKVTVKETLYLKQDPRLQLFVGGFGGYNTGLNSLYLGPTIMLKNKRENTFNLGIAVGTGKEVLFQGGIYKLLKLKK